MHSHHDSGPGTLPSPLPPAAKRHEGQPPPAGASPSRHTAAGGPAARPTSVDPATLGYLGYAAVGRTPAQALAVELEANEGAAYRSLFEVAASLHGAAAFNVLPLDGANVFVSPPMRKPGVFNRVLGMGLGAPLSPAALQGLRESFEREGCTPAFDLVPQWLAAPDFEALRGTRIRRAAMAAVLYRWLPAPVRSVAALTLAATSAHGAESALSGWPPPMPDALLSARWPTQGPVVVVVPARGEQCRTAAAICAEVFEMPEAIESVLAALHKQPGWQLWLALIDGKAAGAALSFTRGRRCWFGWDATLPAYRGRGVKGALDDARIAAAQAAGCSLISSDTDIGTASAPDLSLRSLRRRGFEIAYVRATYLPVPSKERTPLMR